MYPNGRNRAHISITLNYTFNMKHDKKLKP